MLILRYTNALPETSAQNSEHDPISAQIGYEILTDVCNSMTSAGPICNRIILDPWHIFDRISIPKTHGLCLLFARAMQDAIFLINEEDHALVEAQLKYEGSSWDEKFKFQPKSLSKLA